MTPTCPVHNLPMSPSKRGSGFYCARKMPDGSWCTQKYNPPRPKADTQPPPAIARPGASSEPTTSSDVALRLEALRFAQQARGIDLTPDEILSLAREAYQFLKEG